MRSSVRSVALSIIFVSLASSTVLAQTRVRWNVSAGVSFGNTGGGGRPYYEPRRPQCGVPVEQYWVPAQPVCQPAPRPRYESRCEPRYEVYHEPRVQVSIHYHQCDWWDGYGWIENWRTRQCNSSFCQRDGRGQYPRWGYRHDDHGRVVKCRRDWR